MNTSPTSGKIIVLGVCLLWSASAVSGMDGVGTVYIPNALDDPILRTVALRGLDATGHLQGGAVSVFNGLQDRVHAEGGDFRFDPLSAGPDRVRFGEVMAYSHAAGYEEYAAALGFPRALLPVRITAFDGIPIGSGFYEPVPSHYDCDVISISLATTELGDDSDALDGDIIVHEYAHAVQHRLLGGQPGVFVAAGGTDQALALMEGLADYAAASYFADAEIGEWSAAIWRGRPFLRSVENFRCWPPIRPEDGAHALGMIISGAMWDLRWAIGARVADTLGLRMIQLLPDGDPLTPELNATFTDALDAILRADGDVYRGNHQDAIRRAFAVRGIGTWDFSTPFPMVRNPGDNYEGEQTYSSPGADALALRFDRFCTKLDDSVFNRDDSPLPEGLGAKNTADVLTILDRAGGIVGDFTGRELQGVIVMVPGDAATLRLVTDPCLAPFGYRVEDIFAARAGDANLDGQVNILDLGELAASFDRTEGASWAQGDFDFDGNVDIADLGQLAANYGGQMHPGVSQPSSAAPSVSEPGTLLLWLSLAIGRRGRRVSLRRPRAS